MRLLSRLGIRRALVDKRLYLPESWTSDDARCQAAGVPEERRNYRSKTELTMKAYHWPSTPWIWAI